MEIQARSHNGDPNWFTPWRSKLVPTTEFQICSQNTLCHGDLIWFPQRRFEPVPKTHYTMEIQGGSHKGDPSRFPQQCVSAPGG